MTNYEPSHIMIDNEAAIAMSCCNKDTAGNRHLKRWYHYVQQSANLKGGNVHWEGKKRQLANSLTKEGGKLKFKNWREIYIIDMDSLHSV